MGVEVVDKGRFGGCPLLDVGKGDEDGDGDKETEYELGVFGRWATRARGGPRPLGLVKFLHFGVRLTM